MNNFISNSHRPSPLKTLPPGFFSTDPFMGPEKERNVRTRARKNTNTINTSNAKSVLKPSKEKETKHFSYTKFNRYMGKATARIKSRVDPGASNATKAKAMKGSINSNVDSKLLDDVNVMFKLHQNKCDKARRDRCKGFINAMGGNPEMIATKKYDTQDVLKYISKMLDSALITAPEKVRDILNLEDVDISDEDKIAIRALMKSLARKGCISSR